MADDRTIQVRLDDPALTHAFGLALGRAVRAGDVLLLRGDLGAGKTTLVRSIAEGMGIDPSLVSSPTFVVMQQYQHADADSPALVHLDAYRAGEDDTETLGLDRAVPGAVVCVEWPDRLGGTLGQIAELAGGGEFVHISLEHAGETEREARLLLPHAWDERPTTAALRSNPPRWCPKTGDAVAPDCRWYPFASERARLADLNGWFVESYRMSRPVGESDLDAMD